MVRVAQGDNFRGARIAARRDNRRLVRLRAAVGEETLGELAARGERGDLRSQQELRLRGEKRRDVLQAVELLVDLAIHPLVAVPHAHHHDATKEIQIPVSVDVVDVLVLGVGDDKRLGVVVDQTRETGARDALAGFRLSSYSRFSPRNTRLHRPTSHDSADSPGFRSAISITVRVPSPTLLSIFISVAVSIKDLQSFPHVADADPGIVKITPCAIREFRRRRLPP